MSVHVEQVSRRFGSFAAVDRVSLQVQDGEFVALLGPSGSGKTTLLRLIAGLETPDEGRILIGGRDLTHAPIQARGVGFVFQHYALFRHMSVFENVAFGLRAMPRERRPSDAKIAAKVHDLLRLIQLEGHAQRLPSQLSGGQRQRVALARALAVEPRVLLLDEPFGALDARVRAELRAWLRGLHDALGFTSLFVTHDHQEALELADRVAIFHQGHVQQLGAPVEVFDRPSNAFVLEFLGDVNLFDGTVQHGHVPLGPLKLPAPGFPDGAPVRGGVRSFDLKLWADPQGVAQVERVLAIGDRVRVEARLDGGYLLAAQFPRRSSLLKGVEPRARAQVEITHAHLYPRAP